MRGGAGVTSPPLRELVEVFVVSRPSRSDRREAIASQLTDCQLPTHFTSDWGESFDWTTFEPRLLSELQLFPWRIPSDNVWWSRELKLGEIGCSLAHDACWRRFLNGGADVAIVLEDDAVLTAGLSYLSTCTLALLRGSGWDLCYLGRVPMAADQPSRPGLVRPGYSHCTYGYLLTRHAAEQLVATSIRQNMMPADEFIPAHYLWHPRGDVAATIRPTLVAFAREPAVVLQLAKETAGSDTEASPFLSEWLNRYT